MKLKIPDQFSIIETESSITNVIFPNTCPRCYHAIEPKLVSAVLISTELVTITFQCKACLGLFLSDFQVYKRDGFKASYESIKCVKSYPKLFQFELFDDAINNISPSFVTIYNQSKAAESSDLDQIAGVGYRKSLEFLVKDYAISLNSKDDKSIEKIRNMSLVQCIESYIVHPRIGGITKRAAWLGNDETHYVKKYTDENIETLKSLIKLSVNWITMDLDSAALEEKIVHPSQLQMPQ